MKLKSLHLQNFRGFEVFDLDLHEDVTVLVGRNTAGKTAVLDGLAVGLGAWMRGTTQARSEDRSICLSDARLVRQEAAGLPTANPSFPVVVTVEGTVRNQSVSWTRELLHRRGRTTTGKAKELRAQARLAEASATEDAASDLPLIAYYGTGRLWVQKHDTKPQRLGSRMQGYAACLATASNTKLFQRWMAWREADRLQRIASAQEHGADLSMIVTPHLDAVVEAARLCLPGVKRFFYSVNHKELRLEFEDGRVLPFERLSDGQRSLVVLAADLAWRAAQLNPHHGQNAARRANGVVLIDEVELHLHPAWQRRAIGDLVRTFPNIQFVVTTHSPQVVATSRPEWIRVLKDHRVGRVSHVFGRDSNAILRDVMGVGERPSWMDEALAKIELRLESGDLQGARELLEAARQDVGESDSALMALAWELRDQEVSGAGDTEGA